MTTSQPKRIMIIDPSGEGHGQLLETALIRARTGHEITTRFDHSYVDIDLANHDLAFVVLNEEKLSLVDGGILANLKPCSTIEMIWRIAANQKKPVHVFVPTERLVMVPDGFTPLDTLALTMSSVAGIWEINQRIMVEKALASMIQNLESYWRLHQTLLYGRPASVFYEYVQDLISPAWPTTIETENGEDCVSPLYVRYCFNAALALAALTVEEFTLVDETTHGMEAYAKKLLESQNRTGLVMATSVLARALRYLDRRWKEQTRNYSTRRRNEMPDWARGDLFPRHLPAIRDVHPLQISRALFEGLQQIQFERDWEPHKSNTVAISMNRR